MTVIAFDGRYIAADSQVTQGNRRSSADWQKLIIEDGVVFGFTGYAQNFDGELMDAYFRDFANCKRARNERGDWCLAPKKGSGVQGFLGDSEGELIVFDHSKLLHFNGHSHGHPNSAPAAFGSGAPYALGAMSCGASAMAAVDAASRWDLHCSGDILYVDTKKIKAGVRLYGPTQRRIVQREAVQEESDLLVKMQRLAEKEVTLGGIAAEVDLHPKEIADFLPEIAGREEYAELAFAIEVWRGE